MNDYAIGCLRYYLENHKEMGVRNERSVQLTHAIAILRGEVSDEWLDKKLKWLEEKYDAKISRGGLKGVIQDYVEGGGK